MNDYFEIKQDLIKRNIVSIIKKYDEYAVNEMTNNYSCINIVENELSDKLVQLLSFQNNRIAYLEHQLAELRANNDLILEDTEKLNAAYETICKDIELKSIGKKNVPNTPKLAIFSPMPPLKNGIADYNVKIIVSNAEEEDDFEFYINANNLEEAVDNIMDELDM